MVHEKNNLNIFFIAIMAMLIFLFHVYVDDYGVVIKDRENYLYAVVGYQEIFERYLSYGPSYLFLNEPFYIAFFYLFDHILIGPPEIRLGFIVSLVFYLSFYIVIKNNIINKYYLLLLIIFPELLINYVVTLRVGFALLLFLFGYYSNSRALKWVFFGLAIFTHSIFIFLVAIIFISDVIYKANKGYKKLPALIYFLIAALFYLALCVLADYLDLLSLRQAETYKIAFDMYRGSGYGLIFVTSIFLLLLSEDGRNYTVNFSLIILGFYIAGYYLFPPIARFFEAGSIFVIISGLYLKKPIKNYYFCILILYELMWYFQLIWK